MIAGMDEEKMKGTSTTGAETPSVPDESSQMEIFASEINEIQKVNCQEEASLEKTASETIKSSCTPDNSSQEKTCLGAAIRSCSPNVCSQEKTSSKSSTRTCSPETNSALEDIERSVSPSGQMSGSVTEQKEMDCDKLNQNESYLNKPTTSEDQFIDNLHSTAMKEIAIVDDQITLSGLNSQHTNNDTSEILNNDSKKPCTHIKTVEKLSESELEKLKPEKKAEENPTRELPETESDTENTNVSSSVNHKNDKSACLTGSSVEQDNADCRVCSNCTENGHSEESLQVASKCLVISNSLASPDTKIQEQKCVDEKDKSDCVCNSSTEAMVTTEKALASNEPLQIFADFSSQSDSDTDGDRLWIAEALDTDDSGETEKRESILRRKGCKNHSFGGLRHAIKPMEVAKRINSGIVKNSKSSQLTSQPRETILQEGIASIKEFEKSGSITITNISLNDSDVADKEFKNPNVSSNVSYISNESDISKSQEMSGLSAVKPCTVDSNMGSRKNGDSDVAINSKNMSEAIGAGTVAAGSTKPSTSIEQEELCHPCTAVPVSDSIIQSGSHVSEQSQNVTLLDKHSFSSDSAMPVLQDLINDISQTIKKEPDDYAEFGIAVSKDNVSDTGKQSLINAGQANQLLAPPRPVSLLQNVARGQTLPSIRSNLVKQTTKTQPVAYLVPVSNVRTQPMKAVTKVSFTNREKLPSTKVSHTIASLPRQQPSKIIGKISPGTASAINIQSVGLQKITELIARKNQIPNYKPPPAPLKLFQSHSSECYHVCYECGDTFYLEKSLSCHKNRMSMKIKYKCEMCHSDVFFYNKCMFLSHLRTHLKIDKSQAVPIHIKSDSISISLVKENIFFAREGMNAHPADGKKEIVVKPNTDQSCFSQPGKVCQMCGGLFTCGNSLAIHFGQAEIKCKPAIYCGICQQYMPATCSLKAHRNLHKDSMLLVCPECGILMVPENSQKFYHHLIDSCYHFSRFIDFSCPKCHVVLESSAALNDHLMLNVNQYFKCISCPMAFKTLESFKNHFRDSHNREMEGTVTRVVFRCHICDSVMDNKSVLELHVNVHIADAKKGGTFKYRCRYCLQVFITKNNLGLHIHAEHTYGNSLKCTPCGTLFQTKKELAFHHLNHHNSLKIQTEKIQSCKKCGFLYLDKDINSGHTSSQDCCNFIYKYKACVVCSVNCRPGKSLVTHLTMHQKQGILVCHKCNNDDFNTEDEFSKHLLSCTQVTEETSKTAPEKNEYPCDQCYKYFNSKEELQCHTNSEHKSSGLYPCHLCGLTYETNHSLRRHIKIIHEGKRHVFPCYMCRKKNLKKCFSKRTLLERHLASRHHLSQNQWDESQITWEYPGSEEIQTAPERLSSKRKNQSKDVDSPVKRLRVEGENKFICAKCEFSCGEREKFLDHIDGHKIKNSVQCLECGLCFAVLPSLQKHLFIVHKIKDFEQYCEDNALIAQEKQEESSDIEDAIGRNADDIDVKRDPLQCHICYISFESEAACKTHMRTHGMAFLRAKRKDAKLAKSSSSLPIKSVLPENENC